MSKQLPDFSEKQREFKKRFVEHDGELPNIDLLSILESIIFDAFEHVPTPILLDGKKYTLNNFVFDWLGATSTGRTSDMTKRPFKKRKHGIVIDTPTREILISIKSRDKKYCSKCGSMFGNTSSCHCGLCKTGVNE